MAVLYFYKDVIQNYGSTIPFIQFELLSDLINAKNKITEEDFITSFNYILQSDITDIEHYISLKKKEDHEFNYYKAFNYFLYVKLFNKINNNIDPNEYLHENKFCLLGKVKRKFINLVDHDFVIFSRCKFMECFIDPDDYKETVVCKFKIPLFTKKIVLISTK